MCLVSVTLRGRTVFYKVFEKAGNFAELVWYAEGN